MSQSSVTKSVRMKRLFERFLGVFVIGMTTFLLIGCEADSSDNILSGSDQDTAVLKAVESAMTKKDSQSGTCWEDEVEGDGGSLLQKTKIIVDRGCFIVRDSGNVGGTPVIMLHGWPENSYLFEEVASYLDSSLRVIAPDLRGLGRSERTLEVTAYQKLELAKDVLAIADALDLDTFYLVGHDWGGIVAQEMAFLAPQRVAKLVISNIPIVTNYYAFMDVTQYLESVKYFPYWYQYFQMQPNLPEVMIPGNEDEWIKHFFGAKALDGTISPESIKQYIKAYKIKNTPATGASFYRIISVDQERWTQLIYSLLYTGEPKFHMPSLYIYGNQDTVVIPENLNYLDCCFDDITVEELETGHFVMDEKPQEVATLLNNFLL